jgi:4-amino-4-deoxy-L-arabinose transferase-like glycosyltransferase
VTTRLASFVPNARIAALLSLIVGVAGVLRLGGIGAESLWHDEVLTFVDAQAPLSRVIPWVRDHENCPPLYFALVNAWTKVFGAGDVSLRLPSAILGIAAVVLLFALGNEFFDPFVGLTAAALLALSPMHIAYSQEARPYALMFLLLLLCTWALVRMLRSGSVASQMAYVACATAALYTHTFAIFALLALNLFYVQRWLLRRRVAPPPAIAPARWAILQGAVLLLFWPWIPATLEVARMGLPWMVRPTPFHQAMAGYAGGYIALAALALLGIVAVIRAYRRRDDRITLPLLLALVPVLAPLAYGTFTTRYGIAALLGVTMLAAYGAAALGRWGCVVVVALAAIGWAATSTVGHARYPTYTPKPDLRTVARYLLDHARPEDEMENRLGHLDSAVFAHYAGAPNSENVRPERIWLIVPPAPAATAPAGYELVAQRAFDGVTVVELHRKPTTAPASEPVGPASVPSSRPLQ